MYNQFYVWYICRATYVVSVSAFAHKNVCVRLEVKSTLVGRWHVLNFGNR